jgi:hypothetical protein
MRKKLLIAIISCASIALSCGQAALAAEIDIKTEELNQSVNELIEVKDDKSISEAERLMKELEARKQVVKDALSLSLKEIAGLEKSFTTLHSKDERVIAFQKSSLDYLELAKTFYEEKIKAVDAITGLEEIKAAAQNIKDYRDAGYNAKTERINNFWLLNQTDSLIKVAETRWTKIDADLNKLERGKFINPGYFDTNMAKAKKYINDATNLSNEAKEQILKEFETEEAVKKLSEAEKEKPNDNNEVPTATLEAVTESLISEDKTVAPVAEEEKPVVNPKELAEAALTNLKSGYDVFLKISQSVKKILQ